MRPDIPRIERAIFDELESETHIAIHEWVEAAVAHLETGMPDVGELERLRGLVDARFRGLTGYAARQLLANRRA